MRTTRNLRRLRDPPIRESPERSGRPTWRHPQPSGHHPASFIMPSSLVAASDDPRRDDGGESPVRGGMAALDHGYSRRAAESQWGVPGCPRLAGMTASSPMGKEPGGDVATGRSLSSTFAVFRHPERPQIPGFLRSEGGFDNPNPSRRRMQTLEKPLFLALSRETDHEKRQKSSSGRLLRSRPGRSRDRICGCPRLRVASGAWPPAGSPGHRPAGRPPRPVRTEPSPRRDRRT